jgi:hypothetical protein
MRITWAVVLALWTVSIGGPLFLHHEPEAAAQA